VAGLRGVQTQMGWLAAVPLSDSDVGCSHPVAAVSAVRGQEAVYPQHPDRQTVRRGLRAMIRPRLSDAEIEAEAARYVAAYRREHPELPSKRRPLRSKWRGWCVEWRSALRGLRGLVGRGE
jgi:hypothetical protein